MRFISTAPHCPQKLTIHLFLGRRLSLNSGDELEIPSFDVEISGIHKNSGLVVLSTHNDIPNRPMKCLFTSNLVHDEFRFSRSIPNPSSPPNSSSQPNSLIETEISLHIVLPQTWLSICQQAIVIK